MPHQNNDLSPKQRLAVQLIAQGLSRKQVSMKLSIDPGTLSRWRRISSFQQELEKALAQGERDVMDTFRASRIAAFDRLSSLVASSNQSVALKAIGLIVSKNPMKLPENDAPDFLAQKEKSHWDKILQEILDAGG